MLASLASAAIFGAALTTAAALPGKRAETTDADILNYALTLEHLEDNFYRGGLSKFTEQQFTDAGFDSQFYANLQKVAQDESDHVSFLTNALKAAGATPVAECTYDFGYTDIQSFLATASILEGVGVSAYLGAAADIMSKTYLTAAGSILTVEARHSAYLRSKLSKSPFPQPFDAPLTLNEVYSLASPFITSCPSTNPPLPVKAFPALTIGSTSPATTGSTVTFTTKESVPDPNNTYFAFIAVTGPTFVKACSEQGGFSVQIPDGFAGQTYAVLTNGQEAVTDETVIAGPALFEIS